MLADRMPEMGDAVNVGLAPVDPGNRYRVEYKDKYNAFTSFYVSAKCFKDVLTCLTEEEEEELKIKQVTIEKEN